MELLHGTELNIGPDGEVDWDADFLAGFDICVASVHSHFDQSRAEMTRRFVARLREPARQRHRPPDHPADRQAAAGRRGLRRGVPGLRADRHRAGDQRLPDRLDLPSDHIRAARDAGVKFAIDTDAHSVADLGNMRYGVGTAQRGWLTPDDVINTWPLDRLRAFLRKDR